MRRILAILLIGVVALVAACTDEGTTAPGATEPLPTDVTPEQPVAPSVEP